jgi:hypothetical protein
VKGRWRPESSTDQACTQSCVRDGGACSGSASSQATSAAGSTQGVGACGAALRRKAGRLAAQPRAKPSSASLAEWAWVGRRE